VGIVTMRVVTVGRVAVFGIRMFVVLSVFSHDRYFKRPSNQRER
jgi:hypothetical protein